MTTAPSGTTGSKVLLKTLGRSLVSPFLAKAGYQPFFQMLYEVALAGLGFGEGADPNTSGEMYVLHYVKAALPNVPSPIVVFDVGANSGQYASIVIQLFDERASIWSFEPSAKTFQLLLDNLGRTANIRVNNFGFGETNCTTTLYSPAEGSKIASLYARHSDDRGSQMAKQESVRITTVDDFCNAAQIKRINLLKLDVEGHELRVLEGARTMIDADAIDFIQFEFGRANVDSRTYFRDLFYLLNSQYRLYRILKDGLSPIVCYKETYEIFKRSTNYLAQRRGLTGHGQS